MTIWFGRGISRGLGLAAAPTFAAMALLTAASGGGPMDALCSSQGGQGGPGAFPFGGMVPMYVLMSVFHATPWLKLLRRRTTGETI
ncbi:MAG: hypothetical protein LCH93_06665 [Proteobacteria bacterium]|nr:hypothetical protein [Pseudomonadota bacterium]